MYCLFSIFFKQERPGERKPEGTRAINKTYSNSPAIIIPAYYVMGAADAWQIPFHCHSDGGFTPFVLP